MAASKKTRAATGAGSSKFSERTPALEWAAAAFGLTVTLLAIGSLAWEGLRPPEGPPLIVVETQSPVRTQAGYLVPVRIRNLGRSPAASVQIEGVLMQGSAAVETSGLTIDYLPGEGEQKGALIFRRDPAGYRLSASAGGYLDP